MQLDAYDNIGNNWEKSWNLDTNTAFMALDRPAFSIGLSLIFLPVLLGDFKLI
jgi:hypothetical protein